MRHIDSGGVGKAVVVIGLAVAAAYQAIDLGADLRARVADDEAVGVAALAILAEVAPFLSAAAQSDEAAAGLVSTAASKRHKVSARIKIVAPWHCDGQRGPTPLSPYVT